MPAILFLCTYNSVRSQIAEGVCRMLHPGWDIYSAGIARGTISPRVLHILKETGCDCSGMYAKHLTELPGRQYDAIIVLCDNAWGAREQFPKTEHLIYHPVRSPEPGIGGDELAGYRQLREELKEWMKKALASNT
ncbi:hypothetical protein O0S10_02405 [Methanocorpusculum sp. MG]|uniref:Phosphotyrosine protein phosphatase I domain-containing protein n=1 Tax=Methanocorpusculum petauri TaxID=3002863 RepID=A0ABT4IEB0_9EURY|nr:hypothetical protein [Methanocorpusculum petauri]MCZ0860081.1 hypothetical protein [Methanocorpusculum petauri]MDE2444251.1 hypothetical protein [Methanocorpusculum sp.]